VVSVGTDSIVIELNVKGVDRWNFAAMVSVRMASDMAIDFEKLSKELLDYLDSVTDEELLQELIECGLQLEE
jgi:hypothetical protein